MAGNKVLLAASGVKFEDVSYPMLLSPKFDGNRLIIKDGELFSRKMKPQKNKRLPEFLMDICHASKKYGRVFDGEFYSHKHHFTEIQSMRAHDWKPPKGFAYHVFDMLRREEWDNGTISPFDERAEAYTDYITAHNFENVVPVQQTLIHSAREAKQAYEQYLKAGYEGVILRDPNGRYKHGRSTIREALMFKFKRFTTEDAQIIGFIQRQRLTEEYKTSDRGRNPDGSKERSGKQGNYELVPDTIGAVTVRLANGTECNLTLKKGVSWQSLGITWSNRNRFKNRWVEFEFQPDGTKDRPRMGRVIRLRPDLD